MEVVVVVVVVAAAAGNWGKLENLFSTTESEPYSLSGLEYICNTLYLATGRESAHQ